MSEALYRRVRLWIWTDPAFCGLSDQGRLLYFALLFDSNPIPGVVLAGRAVLAERIGWDDAPGKVLASFAELEAAGIATADWTHKVVWFPPALAHQPPDNPSIIAGTKGGGWGRWWPMIPLCSLKGTIYEALRAHVAARGADFAAAFDKTIPAPSVPLVAIETPSPPPSQGPPPPLSLTPSPPPSPGQGRGEERGKVEGEAGGGSARAGAHATVLAWFCNAWEAEYGEPYKPTPADRSQLGRLLGTLELLEMETLPAVFLVYLADREPFIAEKQRHSLAFFCTSGGWNKYRTKPKTGGHTPREVDTGLSAAKFLARGARG